MWSESLVPGCGAKRRRGAGALCQRLSLPARRVERIEPAVWSTLRWQESPRSPRPVRISVPSGRILMRGTLPPTDGRAAPPRSGGGRLAIVGRAPIPDSTPDSALPTRTENRPLSHARRGDRSYFSPVAPTPGFDPGAPPDRAEGDPQADAGGNAGRSWWWSARCSGSGPPARERGQRGPPRPEAAVRLHRPPVGGQLDGPVTAGDRPPALPPATRRETATVAESPRRGG